MEASKITLSEKLAVQGLTRTEKRKIRLEQVKERFGNEYFTSKEFAEAAGFDVNDAQQCHKGRCLLSNLEKIGAITSIPSGQYTQYGKMTNLYKLEYIPEGNVRRKAAETIKKFSKENLKEISEKSKKVKEPETTPANDTITVEIEKEGTTIRFKASVVYLKEIKELVNDFIGF